MFRRFRDLAAFFIAAPLLAACATPAERELQKVSLASEQLWSDYDLCMARVAETSAYHRLGEDYILNRDDPRAIEKMSIDRLASDQEKSDLLTHGKNTDRCNQELFKGFAEINPAFNVLLARFMSEDDELDLRTVRNEVTVGERNLIVHQRYAQRLRDWNFAGERTVRLYAWRLRRTCSVYCSSFTAASLLPTSTEGAANLAGVRPLSTDDAQAAQLPAFLTGPRPVSPSNELAVAPAAVNGSNGPAAPEPAAPAAPATTPATTLVPALATAPIAINVYAAPPPAAATATRTATGTATASTAAPLALTPVPPAPKPAAKAAAEAAKRTDASAAPASGPEVDTGLRPAAGPADPPGAQQSRPAQVAAMPKEPTTPVYTVHLASMRSEVEARAEWGELQARYPAILGDRVLVTREIEVTGKGTYVRVLTGLFHSRRQAKDFCGRLDGRGQYCTVVKL